MSLIKLAKKTRQTEKGALIGGISGGGLGLTAGLAIASGLHGIYNIPIGSLKKLTAKQYVPIYTKLGLIGTGVGATFGAGIGAGVGSLIKKDNG